MSLYECHLGTSHSCMTCFEFSSSKIFARIQDLHQLHVLESVIVAISHSIATSYVYELIRSFDVL